MKRVVLGLLASGSLLTAMMSPARAHEVTIHHGQDAAHANADHHSGWVSDRECDRRMVKAQFRRGAQTVKIVDRNGCDNGKVRKRWSFVAAKFRVCEVKPGPDACTRWRDL
jgi:Ni/Co efflux regulator RcnB